MNKTLTLQKQILEQIKARRVRPVSKGFFKIREYITWGLLGVFVAALSLGFSMIVFMIKGADFELFHKLGLSTTEKITYSIPFFWIAATLALGAVAFISFRNTRRGYKTSTKHIIYISALITVALGSLLHIFNVTRYVDDVASTTIPLYSAVVPLNTHTWYDPEHGLLSGIVKSKDSEKQFLIRDASFELWTVTGDNIVLPDNFSFHPGDRIRIIGTKTGDDTFTAIEVNPWRD